MPFKAVKMKRQQILAQKKKSSKMKLVSKKFLKIWLIFFPDEKYLLPNWEESVDRFDDMGLKEEILQGIYGFGFTKPSPI